MTNHPALDHSTPMADEYEAALIRRVNDLRAAANTRAAIAVLAGGLSELTELRGYDPARPSSQTSKDRHRTEVETNMALGREK